MAVVVALRERQSAPPPEVPVAQTSAKVRVKAVERKMEPVAEGEVAAASGAVAIVCGEDAATAERYEARNDALRSIARRRDLPEDDVAALMAYLGFAPSPTSTSNPPCLFPAGAYRVRPDCHSKLPH